MKQHIESQRFVQELEKKYLQKLAKHVKDLEILRDRAVKNGHNRHEGGCGCNSCQVKAIAAQEALDEAIIKYQLEFRRMYGRYPDQEEEIINWLDNPSVEDEPKGEV